MYSVQFNFDLVLLSDLICDPACVTIRVEKVPQDHRISAYLKFRVEMCADVISVHLVPLGSLHPRAES